MIQQSSSTLEAPLKTSVVGKLKKLRTECQNLKTDLNSIKNMTFKAKRRIEIDIRYLKDSMKTALTKKTAAGKVNRDIDQSDKQNCMGAANTAVNLNQIEVKLAENKPALRLGIKEEKGKEIKEGKKEIRLSERIMLELQEIKLLEQRQNLISKKNLRLNNYYSEHKNRIEQRRTITEQSQH